MEGRATRPSSPAKRGNLCLTNPCKFCPAGPPSAISSRTSARNRHKKRRRFYRHIPARDGIKRASPLPGSLGMSLVASPILPPANSRSNACKLYIEVHPCRSPEFPAALSVSIRSARPANFANRTGNNSGRISSLATCPLLNRIYPHSNRISRARATPPSTFTIITTVSPSQSES